MRIRTQIGITAIVILGTLGLMTAAAVHQQQGRAQLARAQASLDEFVQAAQDMAILSGELLLYPSEQLRERWRTRDHAFSAMFDQGLCCRDATGAALLDAIKKKHARLIEHFDRIAMLDSSSEHDAATAQRRASLAIQVLSINRELSVLLREFSAAKREFAFAELRWTGGLVVLVNLSAFALTALLLWLLWHNLSRPLTQLNRGFERVGSGDMEHRVDSGRHDELGELARGFDRMTERVWVQTQRLRESQAELEVTNRALERKVAARTAELDQANADLEQGVRQLYDAGTELAHTERLATLGKLVASVSHELNNPLMGALNYVQHVRAGLADAAVGAAQSGSQPDAPPGSQSGSQWASLSEWLGKAERDILRASRVTENLLAFGRKGDERRGSIAPAELVAGALELAAPALSRSGVVTENQVPRNLHPVFVQQERLCQVLLNLILNAADALKDVPNKRIIIGGRSAQHRIELFVQDTGPGVPEPLRDRIFEPFFTTKPKGQGTGLGLVIARRLIEGGGGTLSYEPANLGGRFVLSLPPFAENSRAGDMLVSSDLDSSPKSIQRSSETARLE